MLNKILPALYKRLRLRSGLSRIQFAAQIEVKPNTLTNYETGKTRPGLDTERKLTEVSRCSDLELVEMLCEIVSDELRIRVGIIQGQHGYRPATSLASAEHIRQQYGDELSEAERRTLGNKMHTTQLMQLVWERHNADLDEYAADCRANAKRRRQSASDPTTSEPAKKGATGTAVVATPASITP